MPLSLIACLVGGIAVAMIVIFVLAGAVIPGAAASGFGQAALAAVSALVGIAAGHAIHRRFFPAS